MGAGCAPWAGAAELRPLGWVNAGGFCSWPSWVSLGVVPGLGRVWLGLMDELEAKDHVAGPCSRTM